MQKIKYFLFFLSLIFGTFLFGQSPKMRAYMDNKQFYAPGTGNYMEIYFQFVGSSIKYISTENGLQGEVSVLIKITDDQKIVAQDAYRLLSPNMKDSIVEDFYDVKRFALNPGKYTLSIELMDLKSDASSIKASQTIVIEELGDAISISDIEIIEYAYKGDENSSFHKSGYNMIPRLSTFYPSALSSIPVYFELYNTDDLSDTVCGLKQYIIDTNTGEELTEFTFFSRHQTSEVLPILRNVDIGKLPTGTYALNYTLISKSLTELNTQSYLFERSNDIEVFLDLENLVLDPSFQASITNDSVSYYLGSLIPIAKPAEIKNIIASLKTKDLEKQRRHLQLFWLKTSSSNPYEGWLKYKAQVQLVEKLYSNNFQDGYETDRGRVYLQYGSPTNIIIREYTENEYPYEIWQYNKIGVFSNKRFIFYNPDLVNNAYRLLHSDLIGEIKNPSWQLILTKRSSLDQDASKPNRQYGEGNNDLFRQY